MSSSEVLNSPLETPQFYLQQSQQFLELGDVERALAAIDRALAIKEDFIAGLTQLATIYQQQQQFDLALKQQQKIVSLQPDNYQAYADLGTILMAQNRVKDAILVYKKSLAIPNTPVFIYLGLAAALEQDGQLKAAIALYKHTISLFPDNYELRTSLVRCIARQRENKSDVAQEENIQPYSYFFQRGRELIAQGQHDEAIAIYRAGNKQHGGNPFGYFMLGNAYGLIEDKEQQLECYRQAIQLDLSNFQLNLEDKKYNRSTLNSNQIHTTYQKIIAGAINHNQPKKYLLLLAQVASQRLQNYAFFLETAQQLAQAKLITEANVFFEQAKLKGIPLNYFESEQNEMQSLLAVLKQG